MALDLQFYPTPYALALKARNKFKTEIVRLLEPSAGRGDLLEPIINGHRYRRAIEIDCVELDFANQAILRDKKLRVVGHDFLAHKSGAMYSHILMNPPFAQGAEHTLHAWGILYHGELVAILNAETVRNPSTKARQLLCKLIEDYGSVEYLTDEFVTPETQRKTAVEVALVYLKKDSGFKTKFIDGLALDEKTEMPELKKSENELVIPENQIENWVTSFNLACKSLKQAAMYKSRAAVYVGRFDRSIVDNTTNHGDEITSVAQWFNQDYDKLKERAWSTVLRSSKVTEKLSSGMQKSVESQFEAIKTLDFTVSNIYGFLDGIIEQQGELQIGMVLEVFDMISKYHPENRVWYCGWKSNAKHRVNAFRVMHTRFVLPRCSEHYGSGFSWNDGRRFVDFDKVFALLDGKHVDEIYGLNKMAMDHASDLIAGERVSSDYFDLRYYGGKGTFHFFPRRRDLIDRLNRLVGKHRQWLPMDEAKEETAFWEQYDKAEAVNKRMDLSKLQEWQLNGGDEPEKVKQRKILEDQYRNALEKLGIKYDLDSALPPVNGPVGLPNLNAA